jgi:hypothetical protein
VVTAGGTVTVPGVGFLPSERIRVVVTYSGVTTTDEQAATADATGSFTANVKITQPGTATIQAIGTQSGLITSTVVQSLPATGGGSAQGSAQGSGAESGGEATMPVTGSDGDLLVRQVLVAVVALLAGAGLVWLSARRRRPAVRRD